MKKMNHHRKFYSSPSGLFLEKVCPQDIDGSWLQTKITQAYIGEDDPQHIQNIVDGVLSILAIGKDCEAENKLMVYLQFFRSGLVKQLILNRRTVLWCTRLAQAKDQSTKNAIVAEMARLGYDDILEELSDTREENLEKRIREEARRLKDETGVDSARELDERVDRFNGGWSRRLKKELDLDNLALNKGGLLVLYEKWEFPGKSLVNHKDYEEYLVTAKRGCTLPSKAKVVEISHLPVWAQPAFSGVSNLNLVQSKVYWTALFSEENVLVCAPAGAGKTYVVILSMLHLIGLNRNDDGFINHNNYKIVYIVPTKAMVAEVLGNLSCCLGRYGVKAMELAGDPLLSIQQIEETQIIVTTPEQWDIFTRQLSDCSCIELVKLMIIDDIHLMHHSRGPVIESLVARTVGQMESKKQHIRLVGLSPISQDSEDVATFLQVNLNKGLFCFNNNDRPTPLHLLYVGIKVEDQVKRSEMMTTLCCEKVMKVAEKQHQVLVFVNSVEETINTARAIRHEALANATLANFLEKDGEIQEALQLAINRVKSSDLKELLPSRLAIYHEGMLLIDRRMVENLFSLGHIQVLVSTASLAWGVMLSAQYVIIKDTQLCNLEKGASSGFSPPDVIQMLGRAGIHEDVFGNATIITRHSGLQYYWQLINDKLPVESQFLPNLVDHLNAEIVLGSVQNAREACKWLSYTYLGARMVKNRILYGLAPDVLETEATLEELRADLIHTAATVLDRKKLVTYDPNSGYLQATDLGRVASYRYMNYKTISKLAESLDSDMGDIELYGLISLSEELKNLTVPENEIIELADLADKVHEPIEDSTEFVRKINTLVWVYVLKMDLRELSLTSDLLFIAQHARLIMRAIFELLLKRRHAKLAEKALEWCKMICKRVSTVQTPIRQFDNILEEHFVRFEKLELSWDDYCRLSSQDIGELIKFPTMGQTIHKCIHQLPKFALGALVQPITSSILRVKLTITPEFQWDDEVHGYVEPFWVIVEDSRQEFILHHETFLLEKEYSLEVHTLNFNITLKEPFEPLYFIKVISDRWLGEQSVLAVSWDVVLPVNCFSSTELIHSEPCPVTALGKKEYEALYSQLGHFNPVQSQVFHVLYNTDDNVLVAAPHGSGKTICAEFAVLRNFQKEPGSTMHAVYIAPVEAVAKERYDDWAKKFGKGLGMRVNELTGVPKVDFDLLGQGEITIGTPEKWDAIYCARGSRYFHQITLFIIDELHMIGEEGRPILEIIVSRLRHFCNQHANRIRIVALSTSVANATDLGEWIGATPQGIFNFLPVGRLVDRVPIVGIDIANFEARMHAMSKFVCAELVQHAKTVKTAIVFAPSKKFARLIAVDLMRYSGVDGEKPIFLLLPVEELAPFVARIEEPTLKEAISFGVGFLHDGLTCTDQKIVKSLFETGWIQVCVLSSSMCWGAPMSADLVIVMETQHFHFRGNTITNTDYRVTDLLKMIGHVSGPPFEDSRKCVILCHEPRRKYYEKFLREAYPVESHLQHYLHDVINTGVVMQVIQNKLAAVEYLTWTFMYKRLHHNTSYYAIGDVSNLVDARISDLLHSHCFEFTNGLLLSPKLLGRIASVCHLGYRTVEHFSSCLAPMMTLESLLKILALAPEFEILHVRPGEEELIQGLISQQRFSLENPKLRDPHVKAHALLHAHFSRQTVKGDLASDQQKVVLWAGRMIPAVVCIALHKSWLSLSLLAIELSQMVIQGCWESDSPFVQVPAIYKRIAHEVP